MTKIETERLYYFLIKIFGFNQEIVLVLQIAHNSAILVNNAVKCWNTLWQYSCDGPNALPDGGAFFTCRYGGFL